MKKTKGAKLLKKMRKIKEKIRKAYAVGTKVRYISENGNKDKILTITGQDMQDVSYVRVIMDNECIGVDICNLEIIKSKKND